MVLLGVTARRHVLAATTRWCKDEGYASVALLFAWDTLSERGPLHVLLLRAHTHSLTLCLVSFAYLEKKRMVDALEGPDEVAASASNQPLPLAGTLANFLCVLIHKFDTP